MNSNNSEAAAVRSLAAALALGPPPLGNLAVPVYAHGTAMFFAGEKRVLIEPGAIVFVAAGGEA